MGLKFKRSRHKPYLLYETRSGKVWKVREDGLCFFLLCACFACFFILWSSEWQGGPLLYSPFILYGILLYISYSQRKRRR